MLPLLISNPRLEYADTQAQHAQHHSKQHSSQRRHHDVSRAAPALHPLLDIARRRRILHLRVQFVQPLAPVAQLDRLFFSSSVLPHVHT